MTMFTRPRVSPTDYHESTDWLRPSFGGYLSTVAQDAIHDFPTVAVADLNQLYGISAQSAGISMDYDETGFPVVSYSKQTPDIMDTEAQAQRIKEAGLEKELKPEAGYSGPMLDVIIDRKKAELERKTTRAAAPDSWAPAGLAAGLGVSMLDPINIASAFLPIVPEARAMSLLDKAGTGLRRAAVRGGIGAVEGAGGAAVLEPLTAMTRNQEQADYGLADSLSNVAFGAVFGAALHPAAGAAGDWLRAKAGMRQNWEFSPSTPDTMALKDSHAKDIFAAREAATPDADKTRLGQESQAAAALFDARARAWAYDMQRPVSEYYERWRPDYTANGDTAADALTHPMVRATDATVADFVTRVSDGEEKKSYFEIQPGAGAFEGVSVRLPADSIRHKDKRHPNMTSEDMNRLPQVLHALSGENIALPKKDKPRFSGKGILGWAEVDGKTYGVILESTKADRAIVATYFKDSPEAVKAWFDERANKEKAVTTPAALWPAQASNEDVLRNQPPSGENIIRQDSEGKSDSPRAAVNFDADGKSLVQFFESSDFSSAPHELYHVFRREMEQTAAHPDAPARVREGWDKMLEFVGAEPGMAWTREMEEKFAKAGERFLLEGKAPSPALQDVFERLRQWFLELYASADASGLDISDDMRTVFGNMLSTPMKDGDAAFRYALGSLMTRSFAEDAETRLPKQPELDGKPLEVVQSLGDEAVKDLDAQWRQTQEAHPELKDTVGEAYRKDVSVAEAEAVDAARRKEILDEIALCETRH